MLSMSMAVRGERPVSGLWSARAESEGEIEKRYRRDDFSHPDEAANFDQSSSWPQLVR